MGSKTTYQAQEDRFIDQRISNVKSDLIEITHDKLENILLKYLKNIAIIKSWITPLSLLVTLLIAELTATFKEFIGIKASVWEALFLLGAVGSFIWLVVSLFKMYQFKGETSIDYLMGEIKNAH
jgi:hypothetical protein